MIEKLYKIFLESKSISIDTRKITEDGFFFALKGENFNGNQFASKALEKGASYVVIDEPEFKKSDKYILVDDVLTSLQELANHYRKNFNIPFIAVTGSNGKTTTKELLYEVLSTKYKVSATKGNFNNHIGVPLTLLAMPYDTEVAIIEMGDNHIGEVAELCLIAEPTHGLITNIGKDHIENFGSFENNIKAKKEIFDYLSANNGIIFVNAQDDNIVGLIPLSIKTVFYAKQDPFSQLSFLNANPFIAYSDENGNLINTNLIGSYNFKNIQTVYCIAKYLDVSNKLIHKAISNYEPTNNRSQFIQKDNGNIIILDAYNANPSSVEAALQSFAQVEINKHKVVILGDMFELGSISEKEHLNIVRLALNKNFENCLFCGKRFYEHKRKKGLFFETKIQLITFLKNYRFNEKIFLIKGSRGMTLEEVAAFL